MTGFTRRRGGNPSDIIMLWHKIEPGAEKAEPLPVLPTPPVLINDKSKEFKRVFATVKWNGQNSTSVLEIPIRECIHLKGLSFRLLQRFYSGARAPIFYPGYEARFAKVGVHLPGFDRESLGMGDWKRVDMPADMIRNWKKGVSLRVKVDWGTSSDLAIANAPLVEDTHLVVIFIEDTDNSSKSISIESLIQGPVSTTCSCGQSFDKYVQYCPSCGELIG